MKTIIGVEEGKLYTGSAQDVEGILEDSKARHNAGMFGTSEMRHVAQLPMVIVEKYCNDAGIKFHEFMADQTHINRLVSSPDLEYFRIWKGAI